MWKALIKLVEKWACKHEWHLRTESLKIFILDKFGYVGNVVKLRK